MGFEQRIAPATEVVCTRGILGGKPCVSGTRVPAETILLYLKDGASRFEIFSDYPSLPLDGIEAVARWAAEQGVDVHVPNR